MNLGTSFSFSLKQRLRPLGYYWSINLGLLFFYRTKRGWWPLERTRDASAASKSLRKGWFSTLLENFHFWIVFFPALDLLMTWDLQNRKYNRKLKRELTKNAYSGHLFSEENIEEKNHLSTQPITAKLAYRGKKTSEQEKTNRSWKEQVNHSTLRSHCYDYCAFLSH